MTSPVVYSSNFNAEDAEVTFESSDGVRFRVHAVNLKVHTGGFPSQGLVIDSEPAPLPELASILEILFNFIYPRRQLNLLKDIGFDSLKHVAEAAEKYQVYPAMYSCFLEMKESITPDHVSDVLAYALKHDYASLANKTAPIALDRPIFEVLNAIPLEQHMRWVRYLRNLVGDTSEIGIPQMTYYHGWREVQKKALTHHVAGTQKLVSRIAGSVSSLHDLEATFKGVENVGGFKSAIKQDIELQSNLTIHLVPPSTLNDDPRTHEVDGDIQIECSNKVRLRADRNVLMACAPGFPLDQGNEVLVVVPERSSIMLILLSFLRDVRCPDLSQLEFSELRELGEAAEKYQVYQAMNLCRFFIRRFLPSNAEDIFTYAAKYGYLDILDESAPLVLGLSLEDISAKLPGKLFQPWITYVHQWQKIAQIAATELIDKGAQLICYDNYRGNVQGMCGCHTPFSFHSLPIITKLYTSPHWLVVLDELIPPNYPTCQNANSKQVFDSCKATIKTKILDIRPLSSYINPPVVESS